MKRKSFVILLLAAMLMLSMVGCGSSTDATVLDLQALASELSALSYDDELIALPDALIESTYSYEGAVETIVYAGSGATAEEIILVECESEKAAEAVKDVLDKYLSSQLKRFTEYNPLEVPKLEKGIVLQRGVYVLYCVPTLADNAQASEIMSK